MKSDDVPYFNFSDPDQFLRVLNHLHALQKRGGIYEVKITRPHKQWSKEQMGYLWGQCYPHVAKGVREQWGEAEGGFNSYDAHEFLKDRFLKRAVGVNEHGEAKGYVVPSISNMSMAELSHYIENVIKFAQEFLGVTVPPAVRFTEPPEPVRVPEENGDDPPTN